MKITKITTYLIKEWRTMLFVKVETDEGIIGVGEAGLTSREQGVAGIIEALEPMLIGADPMRSEHLWQLMWRSGFHPSNQVLTCAIAAIDIALWDIKGKALGVPVYQLLGGKVRDKVNTYCHMAAATPEELLGVAKQRVAEGWNCIRWDSGPFKSEAIYDPNHAVDWSIEAFRLLRTELGPKIELAFDAHTRTSVTDAVRLCRGVEDYRPLFIEYPLRIENPESYRRLRQQTAVPIAAGEQLGTKWQFRSLIEEELIDYARIDMCIAAGFTESRKIAGWAETHYIDIAVHNPIGPISTAACLHLNVATPNMLVQELPRRPGECLGDVIVSKHRWEDGWLYVSDEPGLGLDVDWEGLARYPFKHESLPIFYREDGALTNW
ncbi:galactonate dehydratase [Devosia sp. MC1541]|uniref:galactonate dehydratase n=1 Tax=Devosia sp. MC1541 TaxID=2725264 RepID=UPI00145D3577|nr:galactonate dehydratase [Devosia sp. MC1541]